jgi:hypothetical protein
MQVDALALTLRPRCMMEASDLGVRLVQSRARSVWRSIAPLYLVVVLVALSTVEIASWLPGLIVFWLKPWLDRSILFVLSRAVFGEDTRASDLWRAQRSVWWGQLLLTLTLRRLSPWRSFTQPAYQLEGQHGSALRKRRKQLLHGKSGAALAMHAAFAHVEVILGVALFGALLWLEPSGHPSNVLSLVRGEHGAVVSVLSAACYAAVVLVVEPFYVAAGFAMYLNRRVELEAWDIEQEFRRAFAG